MPHTSLVYIIDREADFFELFDDQRNNCSSIDLLVRAKHDRGTTGEHRLFDTWKGYAKLQQMYEGFLLSSG